MLDQLIYTRCSPHRDIKNNGKVIAGDGFGFFSVSPELFEENKTESMEFWQTHIPVPNASKETAPIGLIRSYEYNKIGPNTYMFIYEVGRPLCTTPRKSGLTHRPGTLIKQILIGTPKQYPYEWFGADCWDAHLKSENDYYLDHIPKAEPDFLPQIEDVPKNGKIGDGSIKSFLEDGRKQTLKMAVWFLLSEFKKPEGERNVLLIKDVPENVELWIAAIQNCFSEAMAREITFTTNRGKLGMQIEKELFYYTDEEGRAYQMRNGGKTLERHPYCMIVGYHPKDAQSSTVKQLAMSNFVILDGTTKTIGVTPDETIGMAYYRSVMEQDEDLDDFCQFVIPSLRIKGLNGELPELFDAYKYILDSNHKSAQWSYTGAMKYLKVLFRYGMNNEHAMNEYILKECLDGYHRFAEEDEQNNCEMLKLMYDLAKTVGKAKDVTGCMADRISDKLNTIGSRQNTIGSTWSVLTKNNLVSIIQPVLKNLFNDADLSAYSAQFKTAGVNNVHAVMDMFFYMLKVEGMTLDAIEQSREKLLFVCLAVRAFVNERNGLKQLMNKFSASPSLFSTIAQEVAKSFDPKDKRTIAIWWDIVIDVCDGDIVNLCKKLCASKDANLEIIEQILANKLEKIGQYDRTVFQAFQESVKMLGRKTTTGQNLYSSWIKIASLREIEDIIRAIRKANLSDAADQTLFEEIDSKLPYIESKEVSPAVYREMERWGDSLNRVSRSASFYHFRRNYVKEAKKNNIENAIELVQDFAEQKFEINARFLSQEYYDDIIESTANLGDGELHLSVLSMFADIEGIRFEQYMDEYVARVFAATKGRYILDQLLAFCEAVCLKYTIPSISKSKMEDYRINMEKAVNKHIVKYYKASFMDQLDKIEDCQPIVRKKIEAILDAAEEKAQPKGIGKLFGSLFGGKNKK